MEARPVKLEWITPDDGVLTLRCSSRSEVNEFLDLLCGVRPPIVFDNRGDGICIRLTERAAELDLSGLPGDIALSVHPADAPALSPRWLMVLANNHMHDST